MTDTAIREPVTEECNRVWSHMLACNCKRLRVGDHGASTYVTLVAMEFEQQEELRAPSIEWKSSEFRLFAVCLLFCVVIMVIVKHLFSMYK